MAASAARRRQNVGQIISYTLDDVHAIRREIERQAIELGNCVALSTTLDAATREEWRSMRNRVADVFRDDPSWFRADSQYRRLEAVQKDLLPWYTRLSSAGCPGLPAQPTQPTRGLISPGGFAGVSFDQMVPLLLLVGAVYLFANGKRR